MTKKILSVFILILLTANTIFAAEPIKIKLTGTPSQKITPLVASGIRKYKQGNYTGCLQDLNNYIKNNPKDDNQLALYYLGMSYSKVGQVDYAKAYYNAVVRINRNNTLGNYANKGIACLEGSPNCYTKVQAQKKSVQEQSDLDKFVNRPYGNGLSADLTKELQRQRLEKLRKEMNTENELNKYEFKDFKDYSRKKSSIEDASIKIASAKPTDAEVLNAIKVLNDAGLNNIAQQAQINREEATKPEIQTPQVTSEYKPDLTREQYQQQIQREMMEAQMASMTQPNVGMLFGDKNAQNNNYNNNNNYMNMLPFMMAQQAQNGQKPTMTPEAMQAMMFSSMMPNLDFSSGSGQ